MPIVLHDYTTVDDIAANVAALGRGTLLTKIDIESSYRLISVHPDNRPLQAMRWDGSIYVDPMLLIGLQSAPKTFNAVADAPQWILQQAGLLWVYHYLDDFILIGSPHTQACSEALAILDQICTTLKIPKDPVTCLTFLGIVIDSDQGQLRLPTDELSRLRQLLEEWVDSHTALSMIQFHLKVSKCDQFGSGAYVVVGRMGCLLCPVQALSTTQRSKLWGDGIVRRSYVMSAHRIEGTLGGSLLGAVSRWQVNHAPVPSSMGDRSPSHYHLLMFIH